MKNGGEEAHEQTAAAIQESRSRLVAYLAARSGDVAAAEDALADAGQAALETWPVRGVPQKPEAWLLAAAKRKLIDRARHYQVRDRAADALRLIAEEAAMQAEHTSIFPDERLKLLFICAHPAIDAAARTPLMLQTVLGLDATRIAKAFVVSPSAMGQRLVRAKAKIRDARISFEIPEMNELPDRLDGVLEAIYAAYGTGWEEMAAGAHAGLSAEAIQLARLVADLLPDEAEAHGLLAFMLFCESRRGARRDDSGRFVPLSEQDVTRWSQPMIEEAKATLARAAAMRDLGHYQLEAAVQALHAVRVDGDAPPWEAIASLYDSLCDLWPSMGAWVSRAAAIAEARGPLEGLKALSRIESESVGAYQPYWATRGRLLADLGRKREAAAAFAQAIDLTADDANQAWLREQHDALAP